MKANKKNKFIKINSNEKNINPKKIFEIKAPIGQVKVKKATIQDHEMIKENNESFKLINQKIFDIFKKD